MSSLKASLRYVYQVSRAQRLRLILARLRLRLAGSYVRNVAGHRIYLLPDDPRALWLHFSDGVMDKDAVRLWSELARILDPSVLIDVGANYGEVLLSQVAYRPDARLVAVEPNLRIAAALRRSLEAAGWDDALVMPLAASDELGISTLRADPRSSGNSSLDRQVGGTPVVTARIDDLIAVTARDNLLMKIDVEGHEAQVLDGAIELLSASKSWAVVCEVRAETIRAILESSQADRAHLYSREADRLIEVSFQQLLDMVREDFGDAASPWGKDVVLSCHADALATR